MAPAAARIRRHVEETFGAVVTDHVALRTFDLEGISLRDLEPAFLDGGYRRGDEYSFPDKHLRAFGYRPPTDDLPLVFISELDRSQLSGKARDWIARHPPSAEVLGGAATAKLLSGRSWASPTLAEYEQLEAESPYAAWLSVWGLCANHFTIAVHHLPGEPALSQVVASLQGAGFVMNEIGGVVKGSPDVLLEQASTLAEKRAVTFRCGGTKRIPSSYYELAKRYPDETGRLYSGFVTASARNIFESTTEQRRPAPSERT
jgi:hypothetical protein